MLPAVNNLAPIIPVGAVPPAALAPIGVRPVVPVVPHQGDDDIPAPPARSTKRVRFANDVQGMSSSDVSD